MKGNRKQYQTTACNGLVFWVDDQLTAEGAAKVINDRGRDLELAQEEIERLRAELKSATAVLAGVAGSEQEVALPDEILTWQEVDEKWKAIRSEIGDSKDASLWEEGIDHLMDFLYAELPVAEGSNDE